MRNSLVDLEAVNIVARQPENNRNRENRELRYRTKYLDSAPEIAVAYLRGS